MMYFTTVDQDGSYAALVPLEGPEGAAYAIECDTLEEARALFDEVEGFCIEQTTNEEPSILRRVEGEAIPPDNPDLWRTPACFWEIFDSEEAYRQACEE